MTCGVGMQQMTMSAFIGFRPAAAFPPSASVNGIARLNVSSGGDAHSVGCCRPQAWINRFPTIFRAVMQSLCKNADPNGATGRSLSNSGLPPRWWAAHSSSGRGRRSNICSSGAGRAMGLRASGER